MFPIPTQSDFASTSQLGSQQQSPLDDAERIIRFSSDSPLRPNQDCRPKISSLSQPPPPLTFLQTPPTQPMLLTPEYYKAMVDAITESVKHQQNFPPKNVIVDNSQSDAPFKSSGHIDTRSSDQFLSQPSQSSRQESLLSSQTPDVFQNHPNANITPEQAAVLIDVAKREFMEMQRTNAIQQEQREHDEELQRKSKDRKGFISSGSHKKKRKRRSPSSSSSDCKVRPLGMSKRRSYHKKSKKKRKHRYSSSSSTSSESSTSKSNPNLVN